MAKKLSPRELRKQKKEEQYNRIKQMEQDKATKAEEEKAVARKAAISAKAKQDGKSPVNQKKKSSAKAAGLKSAFIIDSDELLVTSFGRGNSAIIEKYIKNEIIENVNVPPKFEMNPNGVKFAVSNARVNDATIDNPSYRNETEKKKLPAGMDQLRLKSKLEERYFGKTFDDNIHIQLIYSILDIEKILAVHINNIVYEINNLRREKEVTYDDFVGFLSVRNSYDVFCNPDKYKINSLDEQKTKESIKIQHEIFDKLVKSKRLMYLNDFFEVKSVKGKPAIENNKKKDIYDALALIGTLRQFCIHSDSQSNWIYHISDYSPKGTNAMYESRALLDKLFKQKVENLNKDFISKNCERNLPFLFHMYNAEKRTEKSEIVLKFYDFTVKKTYKNIGISVKHLRELLIDKYFVGIKDKSYDSVRSKLYQMIDYIINNYYNENQDKRNIIVEELRECRTEEDKEQVYLNQLEDIYAILKDKIQALINTDFTKSHADEISDSDKLFYENILIKSVFNADIPENDASYFCELIYLVTLFLDGKEINDLLTSLISKFDNIAEFLKIMDEAKIEHNFNKWFTVFTQSEIIMKTLQMVNSFARMQKKNGADAKRIMFFEAAEILGTSYSQQELEEFIDDELGNKEKRKHDFRNFIAKNVIESSRFKYLVRYSDPAKVKELSKNRNLVIFALKNSIASGNGKSEHIDRFYKSCGYTDASATTDKKIEVLADVISSIQMDDYKGINNKGKDNDSKRFKEKAQAVISLYLLVLYQITKNLVYANSRYTLSFHCLERDIWLTCSDSVKNKGYLYLTQKYVDEGLLNKHACAYIKENISHTDNSVLVQYRNSIAHMNAVRNAHLYAGSIKQLNTYFDLYHYIMQCSLEKKCKESKNPAIVSYINTIKEHGGYSRDFLWALNTPFAYNLPRYKNLSIADLFDKNNTKQDK